MTSSVPAVIVSVSEDCCHSSLSVATLQTTVSDKAGIVS